jgi:hypothetical protein
MSDDPKKLPDQGGGAGASGTGSGPLGKWLLATAVVAVVGGGGYLAYQATRSPEQVVAAAAMDAAPRATVVVADAAPVTAVTADAAPAAKTIDAGPARSRVSPQAALAEESRLLGRAKEALTGGDARGALREVTSHARSFPHGKLIEERERLAIEALIRLGRRPDAEARAERFRQRYPRSVEWPRIRELLAR